MLNRDFKEFVALLNSTGVEYLIVGGYPPARIDLLTAIDGVRFDECHARRIEVDIAGSKLALIGLDDLRANKMAAGRAKDLADLEALGEPFIADDSAR